MMLMLRECKVLEKMPLAAPFLSMERSESWCPEGIGFGSMIGTAAIWLVRLMTIVATTTKRVTNFIVGFL
jgi:hypothetical protein